MKITDITATPLTTGKSLVRIHTDVGIEGWAEGPGYNKIIPSQNVVVFNAYLESVVKPVLIGEDPLQIDRHWETLAMGKDEYFYQLPASVVGVIDIALWDLKARSASRPLWRFLGGSNRQVQAYAGGIDLDFSIDELIAQGEGFLAQGFQAL